MLELIDGFVKGIKTSVKIIIIIFIIIAIICSCKAFGNTWTIDDDGFKSIYDDREECINSNLGTGTTEICDDRTQVIYKNE